MEKHKCGKSIVYGIRSIGWRSVHLLSPTITCQVPYYHPQWWNIISGIGSAAQRDILLAPSVFSCFLFFNDVCAICWGTGTNSENVPPIPWYTSIGWEIHFDNLVIRAEVCMFTGIFTIHAKHMFVLLYIKHMFCIYIYLYKGTKHVHFFVCISVFYAILYILDMFKLLSNLVWKICQPHQQLKVDMYEKNTFFVY